MSANEWKLISVRLQKDDLQEFKMLVLRKYGGLHGNLKLELNRAVENHIPILLKEIEVARKSNEEAYNG
jgi:hypothetical protein